MGYWAARLCSQWRAKPRHIVVFEELFYWSNLFYKANYKLPTQ
jgi:hypothetical protein